MIGSFPKERISYDEKTWVKKRPRGWLGWSRLVFTNDKILRRSEAYKDTYPMDMVKYFSTPNYIVKKWKKVANDYKTLQGFAAEIGVSIGTLNKWCKEYEEMARSKEICDQYRYDRLISNGLNNAYNPTVVKLVAQHEFNMSDRVEVNNTWEVSENQRKSMIMEYLNDLKDGEVLEVTDVNDDKGDI